MAADDDYPKCFAATWSAFLILGSVNYSFTAFELVGDNLMSDQAVHDSGQNIEPRGRILMASPDWVGPIKNGGIGTAFTALARNLSDMGWHVTALYTLGDHSETESIEHWARVYHYWGIDFQYLPKWSGPKIDPAGIRAHSYEIYSWLTQHDGEFDLVIFPEWKAGAYYTLWAKRVGVRFQSTSMIVVTHSPTDWAQGGNYWLPNNLDQVDLFEMEPVCVELADYVVSPSTYMFDWMEKRKWVVPGQSQRKIIRNLMLPSEPSIGSSINSPSVGSAAVNEWVFFGRLEPRKGLDIFCRALDRLTDEEWRGIDQVTFLGKKIETSDFSSSDYLSNKMNRWPARVIVIDDKDSSQALEYLSGDGRLAVIASLVENSPYTVLECLSREIRFVAADVGGIAELIDERDHTHVLFPPIPTALAKLLGSTRNGVRAVRLAVPEQEALSAWNAFLLTAMKNRAYTDGPDIGVDVPKVSVCLVHYERPQLLAQALDSLRDQTYENYEVILVDDGSSSSEAIAFLDGLEAEFATCGWRILRQENAYLGAARNTAVRHATGEYLLFMDDDNLAMPDEIETFIRAARLADADIVTSPSAVFSGNALPRTGEVPDLLWLPLGRALGVGAIRNGYGDANALLRRSTFDRLGGFTEDYGVGHEDWEFFARASLEGARFAFVPDPLFRYRLNNGGMLRGGDGRRDHYRSFRPYLASLSPGLGAALGYGLHLHLQTEREWHEPSASPNSLEMRQLLRGLKLLLVNRSLRMKLQHALKNYGLRGAFKKGFHYLNK